MEATIALQSAIPPIHQNAPANVCRRPHLGPTCNALGNPWTKAFPKTPGPCTPPPGAPSNNGPRPTGRWSCWHRRPSSPPLVAVYLGHLVEERRLSVVTIQVHKAALAAVHRVRGHQEQSDNMSVRTMIEKIARAHGESQRQRIGKPGDSVNKPEL